MNSIKQNLANLQDIQNSVNALPEASGGVELPELTNAGSAKDLLINKTLIGQNGNIIVGSMPDNGSIESTMDGLDVKSISIPEGYTSGGTISLDDTIDNEVDTQSDLIAQIASALDGKTAGGSTETPTLDTCTVKFKTEGSPGHLGAFYAALENGELVMKNALMPDNSETICENVLCGTDFYIIVYTTYPGYRNLSGATFLEFYSGYGSTRYMRFHIDAAAGGLATIECYDDD